MGARISWRDAAGLEGQVELNFAEIFVGRAVECAIRTDDPLVSRRHARVYFQNGNYVIEDLQSANGIFLGEVRVQSHTMQSGDSVRCGNLWLRYVNDGVQAFAGPASGPQMSPGGGTQILQINEAFIPGRASEPAAGGGPGLSPMASPGIGPSTPLGGPSLPMPPNPFGSSSLGPGLGGQAMPPPIGANPFGGGPQFGGGPPPSFGGPPPPFGGGPSPSFGGGPSPSFGGGPSPSFGGGPPPSFGGGPSPPTAFGGGGPQVFGGPPPPVGPPPISGSIGAGVPSMGGGPPPPGPPPAVPTGGRTSAPRGPAAVIDDAELQRMQRRIDQLTSELRLIRGGGDRAMRMEELEERASRLEKENLQLEERYRDLEKLAAQTGTDYNPNRANLQLSRAEEVVTGLNDVLSEVRINMLAADGEIQQYAQILPQASFELVREAIRSSRMQMETARDIMRMLREVR